MNITKKRSEKIKRVVERRQTGLTVVLQDIYDPHNAGAIFRTCEAFGIQKIFLVFEKEEPFNPKKVGKKSSSTANKWLDFKVYRSTRECLSELKNEGFRLFATALSEDSKSIYNFNFSKEKMAILVGNEQRGLTNEAIEFSDEILSIPMMGMVQSLNVSVTTGIFIYEITRQRIEQGSDFRLNLEDRKSLEKSFSMK